jgi:hypothetical protein
MKKLWIIPVILFLILLIILPLRWDKGPTQSFGGALKIQYITDRWTGQKWLKLYGAFPETKEHGWIPAYTSKWDDWANNWGIKTEPWQDIIHGADIQPNSTISFAGEVYPHFSNTQIQSKSKKILASNKGINEKEQLQKILKEAESDKVAHSHGHTLYVIGVENISKRFIYPPLDGSWAVNFNEISNEKGQAILTEISQNLKQENDAWQNANKLISNTKQEISNLSYWSTGESKKELTQEAESIKNLATIIWVILIAISFVMTIVLFFKRSNRMLDKSA